MTLFSDPDHQFPIVSESGDPIPTEQFLSACTHLLPLLDVFNATVFAPIKKGVNGDIQRLRDHYQKHPDWYPSLQSFVDREIDEATYTSSNSCTLGLLWLKRSLEFMFVFLDEVASGETDLTTIAHKSYTESLKPYHSFIVRGLFLIIVRCFPTYDVFISSLKRGSDISNEQLMADIRNSLERIRSVINEINRYYEHKGLNNVLYQ